MKIPQFIANMQFSFPVDGRKILSPLKRLPPDIDMSIRIDRQVSYVSEYEGKVCIKTKSFVDQPTDDLQKEMARGLSDTIYAEVLEEISQTMAEMRTDGIPVTGRPYQRLVNMRKRLLDPFYDL